MSGFFVFRGCWSGDQQLQEVFSFKIYEWYF